MPTHYQVLGVSSSASKVEISAEYKKLVLKYHPDKGLEPNGESFKLVQEAYRILVNDEFRIAYNEHLKECKENGSQDIFFTPAYSSSSAASVSSERGLVLRERFSLSDLMKRAGGMDTPSFVAMLKNADVQTIEVLLNDDAIVQKLAYYLDNIAHDFGSAIKDKILREEKIYRHLTDYQKFLFAEFSAEDCLKVLSNPVLSQKLDGEQLFELAAKFSDNANILKIITSNPSLQKKYQAYFNLFHYRLPTTGLSLVVERQKILAWIKDAQINTKNVTGEAFKNAVVKNLLSSDRNQLRALSLDALNNLAEADEKIALEIVTCPVLLKKFTDSGGLGSLYLFWLSEKYLNVCLAVFKNTAAVQWLDGCYLFDLYRHHGQASIYEAIVNNVNTQKRYDAYYQLLHYPSAQAIPDKKIKKHILGLYRQANLSRSQTKSLLKNASVALTLLKHKLVSSEYLVIDKCPGLASYLIENHHLFPEAFKCKIFFKDLINISKAICLHVLSTTALFDRLTGKQLLELCKKYGEEVFNKVLETPILMDKYRAYLSLNQLAQQSDIRVERDQKQFSPPALTHAKSNQDYDRGVFLQEQGKFELAFDYFDKAIKAGYEPAGSAIKSLVLKLFSGTRTLSIEVVRKYMQIAKAFADPRNAYYDESMATLICDTVLKKEKGLPVGMTMECWYVWARRLALGLGMDAPDQEQSKRIFGAMIHGAINDRQLLTCCEADVRERRKIKAELQLEITCMASTQVDDVLHEPAVLFLQNEILACRSPHEKAKRYLDLANFFHRVGGCIEPAQASFESAVGLSPTSLTAVDWLVLGSLQQSKIKTLAEQKSQDSAQDELSAWNQPLSSFLQAVAKKNFLKVAEYAKRDNPAKQQADAADSAEELAVSLITLIYQENPRGMTAENATIILSNPSLCSQITLNSEMGPAALYAICLQSKPLIPPILPAVQTASVVGEPKSLDTEGGQGYITELVEWASTEQKGTESQSKNSAESKLLVLAEMFLNGGHGERSGYQTYLQDCLSALFKKLALPTIDPEQNLANQLFAVAKTCKDSRSELQKSAAERLLNLACKAGIKYFNEVFLRPVDLVSVSVPDLILKKLDVLCELIVNFLDNQQQLYDLCEFGLIHRILSSFDICARLKPQYLYALYLQQVPLHSLLDIPLPLPSESKAKPMEGDYIIRLIDWAAKQGDAVKKVNRLLLRFLSGKFSREYSAYVDYCVKLLPPSSKYSTEERRYLEAIVEAKGVPSANAELLFNAISRGCAVETIHFLAFNVERDFFTRDRAYSFLIISSHFPAREFELATWQYKRAILELFLKKWCESSTPPTPRDMINFIFYVTYSRTCFDMALPDSDAEKSSRRRELFALLISPGLIHTRFSSGYESRNNESIINYTIQSGETLLHAVIRNSGDHDLCLFLLQQGASPNAANAVGDTPLILATRLSNPRLVNLLLSQRGLVIEQTNNNQESACSIALYDGQFALAWLLISCSPIYWNRLLLGSVIGLTLLVGGAGALLFFLYSMSLPGLVCFGVAGLCLLLAGYHFFASPTAALPKSSQRQPLLNVNGASVEPFRSAASLRENVAAIADVRPGDKGTHTLQVPRHSVGQVLSS